LAGDVGSFALRLRLPKVGWAHPPLGLGLQLGLVGGVYTKSEPPGWPLAVCCGSSETQVQTEFAPKPEILVTAVGEGGPPQL
jgi:hypothetical protein